MKSLAQQFRELNPAQKRAVHFWLCEKSLDKWRAYASLRGPIHYTETVVGTHQKVDVILPQDALVSARNGRDLANVRERYREPIAALHDDDLEFPDDIAFAYYSVYNLFCLYGLGERVDDWLIVNQAISAEVDQAKWVEMLEAAIASAGPRQP